MTRSREETDLIFQADFTHVPRVFKSPTWKTPSRRYKAVRQLLSDEQKRLQQIDAESEILRNGGDPDDPRRFEKMTAKQKKDMQPPEGALDRRKTGNIMRKPADRLSYFTYDAPPSIKPRKWYCDITGLPGRYKAPGSGLRYYNMEVYSVIKNMVPGVDQKYLELRNANLVLR